MTNKKINIISQGKNETVKFKQLLNKITVKTLVVFPNKKSEYWEVIK